MPTWKSTLIGGFLVALLFGWFFLVTQAEPGTRLESIARQGPLLLIIPCGLWMIWRSMRGLIRARRLRQNGIEIDAELLDIRSRSTQHWHQANVGIQTKVSSVINEYVDYAIHHEGETTIVRDVPLIIGNGVPMGRMPDTIHVQVDPGDPGNSRPMTTPSNVTYMIRAAQLGIGIILAVIIPIVFATGFH